MLTGVGLRLGDLMTVRKILSFINSLVLLLCLQTIALGGTTGKITGKVSDDETGNPLPGVNIILKNSDLGCATDSDGYFVILNLGPGLYTLQVSMMGYKTVTVKNLEVRIDLTSIVNLSINKTVLDLAEVIVEGKRPIVDMDVSSSQMNIESSKINSLPTVSVEEIVGLQAGIDGMSVRGGDSRQTAFIVDGFITNDERSYQPVTTVSLSAIEKIQIQTGGFNAEYGNIRSGLIQVVTKEGKKDRYSGMLSMQFRPPTAKHYGPSVYADDGYFARPYLDPAVCYSGTANGNWDQYTMNQYKEFIGWDAISASTTQDDDPGNDISPEGARRLFEWYHRRQGDIKKPDYIMDFGFGGPVPFVSECLGNMRFFATHKRTNEMFLYPLSRDSYNENVSNVKMTSDISSRLKITANGSYSEIYSVSPYDWTVTPTGDVLRDQYNIADLVNSNSGNSILYMPGYYSPSSIFRTMIGLKGNHILSSHKFYEINIQHSINRYHTFQTEDRDTSRIYEILPEFLLDEAPYGYCPESRSGIDGSSLGGWMNLGRDKSVIATTSIRVDFTNQVDKYNQIKTGTEIVMNNFNINSYTESLVDTWSRSQVYEVSPYRLGGYFQDKMEFQGFIANLGMRIDYSSANSRKYFLNDYDEYYQEGNGKLIEAEAPREKSAPSWGISPRLGISHPITENSKLYFNYGHFLSEPASSDRFRIQREYNGLVTSIGNPNLSHEKTVAYEFGYSHDLFDEILINISTYYKDITQQAGWIFYQNINNSIQYQTTSNNNYCDIRGAEITIDKRVGDWFTGFVNYTFIVKTSGYFGYTKYFEDPNKQREYLQMNPYQEKPHPQPYARINLDFHTPPHYGPEIGSVYPIGGLSLNLLGNWEQGSYTTYNPFNIPGTIDNVQWVDRHLFDLRISKTMNLKSVQLRAYLDIKNLLNSMFLEQTGFSDSRDFQDYMQSLCFPWENGEYKGDDRVGEYREAGVPYDPIEMLIENPRNYPDIAEQNRQIQLRNENRRKSNSYIDMPNLSSLTFLNPREIRFGIKISF